MKQVQLNELYPCERIIVFNEKERKVEDVSFEKPQDEFKKSTFIKPCLNFKKRNAKYIYNNLMN